MTDLLKGLATGAGTALLGPAGGALTNMLFGGGGNGMDIGKGIGGLVNSVIPGLFGGSPQPISYKPTYGSIYEYNPYDFAPGEEAIHKQLLNEYLTRNRVQEQGQQRSFAEEANRRGLGRSSMYTGGTGTISSNAQNALQQNVSEANRNLQGLHENRAGQQRLMQHQWNLGPGYQGQADTIQQAGAHQNALNKTVGAYTQPYFNQQPRQFGTAGPSQPMMQDTNPYARRGY